MVQFTKRKLGANEVHKIGDMKSLVWGGGEGVGEGVGKGGGKGVVYTPDLLLVILCKYEITFFQLIYIYIYIYRVLIESFNYEIFNFKKSKTSKVF